MKRRSPPGPRNLARSITILYEDRDILVIDKPEGLLTVATAHEKIRTAQSILTDYIRVGRSRKKIFVVHRLDRDTSGVLIFAKSEEAMDRLKAAWKKNEKIYLAVVHGRCQPESGVIENYLAEDEEYIVHAVPDSTQGRLARTEYRVLKTTKHYSLLELRLLTGRKNQIRVHLAGIGHPIVGDTKYGKYTREDETQPRMALHARSIAFKHPFTGKELAFESPVPEIFTSLVGAINPRT